MNEKHISFTQVAQKLGILLRKEIIEERRRSHMNSFHQSQLKRLIAEDTFTIDKNESKQKFKSFSTKLSPTHLKLVTQKDICENKQNEVKQFKKRLQTYMEQNRQIKEYNTYYNFQKVKNEKKVRLYKKYDKAIELANTKRKDALLMKKITQKLHTESEVKKKQKHFQKCYSIWKKKIDTAQKKLLLRSSTQQ